jgi:ATP-binding cassette subfamily B protein
MAAHPLRRLFEHARSERRDVALASLFSVLNKVFDVLPEILIGIAVDVVVSRKQSFLARAGVSDPRDQLVALAVITVVIWVAESGFEYLYAVRWRNLAQNLQHRLRGDAYRHVQHLELSWFERRRTGSLMSVLNDDINQLERFLNGGANDLLQVVTGTLMVSAVFFALAPSIALLSLLPVPLIIYGAFFFQSRLAPRYAEVREAAGALNVRLNNNLLGIATGGAAVVPGPAVVPGAAVVLGPGSAVGSSSPPEVSIRMAPTIAAATSTPSTMNSGVRFWLPGGAAGGMP